MLDDIIDQIDETAVKMAPPMDDYDAGVIEGLRRARAIIKQTHISEYTEFRVGVTSDD